MYCYMMRTSVSYQRMCSFSQHQMKISQQQAKQLKDYENAVIAKRLEELDDDEIQALVEEIERDEF